VNSVRSKSGEQITERFIRSVCARIEQNQPVRRSLPVWGRVHIDRQLPFLCVYRRPTGRPDPGTWKLATSGASYLICSGERRLQAGVRSLIRAVIETLTPHFGLFLIVEIWSGEAPAGQITTTSATPGFKLTVPKAGLGDSFLTKLRGSLTGITLAKKGARVDISAAGRPAPKGLGPLLPENAGFGAACRYCGLEVSPIYQNPATGDVFPALLRRLRRELTRALLMSFFEFALRHTSQRPPHFHALGRRAVVKSVWEADRMLTEVSDSFDFLLQVTPTNIEQAWRDFRRRRFERAPLFSYRPLPAEPLVLKRRLYEAPVERIEDPALGRIFREKLTELERKITMLEERNTPRFIHESAQLYGTVDDELAKKAESLLALLPANERGPDGADVADAGSLARTAAREIERYQRLHPKMRAAVNIRDDVSGLMVTGGTLLIGSSTRVPASRVAALIAHEVGTHLVTYFNGRAQRFHQLHAGLAGYDELQEGLAVLSEYLAGGLTRARLRTLAARVLAVRYMIEGATFVETFRKLREVCGLGAHPAFLTTTRVFRGGGLAKDAVYLRGLYKLLRYLGRGGELSPLFIGKIALSHVPVIRELRWRKVLRRPPLLPLYMRQPETAARLETLRGGAEPIDLVKRR